MEGTRENPLFLLEVRSGGHCVSAVGEGEGDSAGGRMIVCMVEVLELPDRHKGALGLT